VAWQTAFAEPVRGSLWAECARRVPPYRRERCVGGAQAGAERDGGRLRALSGRLKDEDGQAVRIKSSRYEM
jgi:hypothetical protein